MRTKEIGYWVTTALLALAMVSGGVAELARRPDNIEGIVQLGYPVYFAAIIGFWKVLGGMAIMAPRLPRLKEWAYAGIFFNMTGAFASHAASADGAGHLVATSVLAAVTVASWVLRPHSRMLGALHPERAGSHPVSL